MTAFAQPGFMENGVSRMRHGKILLDHSLMADSRALLYCQKVKEDPTRVTLYLGHHHFSAAGVLVSPPLFPSHFQYILGLLRFARHPPSFAASWCGSGCCWGSRSSFVGGWFQDGRIKSTQECFSNNHLQLTLKIMFLLF